MHFEILVEDLSGKKALDVLLPKIIGSANTFRVISYKGLGHIPKDLKSVPNPRNKLLLNNLPKLLRGYGKAFVGQSSNANAVFIICDLDNKCLKDFRNELLAISDACTPKPDTRFCLAIEEGEAWFLGDLPAVKSAYPKAKSTILDSYINDSICGTWEKLADAIYPGGARKLSKEGYSAIGKEKSKWAETITPKMDINANESPSFCYFKSKLQELANEV